MSETTPILSEQKEERSCVSVLAYMCLLCLAAGGVGLFIGATYRYSLHDQMYHGECQVFDYQLIYSTYDGTNVIYTLIFNVTVIDDSAHPIDPDCCYSAMVHDNQMVFYSSAQDLIDKYPYGSNTSCLYRDKNIKYPEPGNETNEIWIGGGHVTKPIVWIILIVIGLFLTCFPCILCGGRMIYRRYKMRKEPIPYPALNL